MMYLLIFIRVKLSLVGESGCGKSTTGKLIDHLITPDSGEIWFEGKEISKLSEKEMRPLRSDIQCSFESIRFPESENESSGSHW